MRVFLQSIYGQLLLGAFIFWMAWRYLPKRNGWRYALYLFFGLELGIFFTGYFFHEYLPDDVMIAIYYICNTWYIASIYITLLILISLVVMRLLRRRLHRDPKRRQKVFIYISCCIIGIVTILMIRGYHDATHPIVINEYITLPKYQSSRDSLRIVMMSDMHFGEMIGKKAAQRFVRLCNEQHPDMVVIVGDVMDYESRFAEKEHIEEDLRQIKAPLGVWIVPGNHEYRANRYAKFRWLRQTGGVLLMDSVVSPDSTFLLVGRDDFINKDREPLQTLLRGKDRNLPVIVLDHQPFSFSEMAMNHIDLGLHGHTHNGQFWPYPLILKLIYEKPYGYLRKGDSQFFVSSGIGFAGPPYRIGTHSELVVLHVKFVAGFKPSVTSAV